MKMMEKKEFYKIYRVLNADSEKANIKIIENPYGLWREEKIILIPKTGSLMYY